MRIQISIIAAALAFLSPAGAKETTLEVSRVGKDKTLLLRVFAQLNEAAEKQPTARLQTLVIQEKISPKTYRVQTPYRRGKPTHTFRLILAEEPTGGYMKGHHVSVKAYGTGLPYQYNYRGEARAINSLTEAGGAPEKPITREEFVANLRLGETYFVVIPKGNRCETCGGTGRITDDERKRYKRGADGKILCPTCAGCGSEDLHVTIKWK